ncbi:MAG: LysM peptidoglycan-binding domain-containing protein [Thermacetogeniaceae bacterium]
MTFCPGGTLYVIKPGDTFYSLARRFGTTVDALIAANPGVDPQNLQIGMTICIPVAPAPGACPGGFTYVIKPGDTFFNLARRFGITVDALIAANPGVDPNNLQIGQTICIPAPVPVPGCPGFIHIIRPGDTLYKLARQFGTSVEAILAANPGIDPNNLQIGQAICIPITPAPQFCPPWTLPYTIQPGDTLYSIAYRFGVDIEDIINVNPGIDPRRLRIGQTICIPKRQR